MNKLHTILVFGAIFAAGLGAVSVNDQAISAFITPTVLDSNSQGISLLGHVEFVVRDSAGNIIQYAQGDNLITTTGGDCIAGELFGGTPGDCQNLGTWDFIAIGNMTSPALDVGDFRLDDTTDEDGLSTQGSGHDGEMARKQVTPGIDVTGSNTIVTLVNTGDAFTFTTTNATTITQSGIFSEGATLNSNGETTVIGNSELLAIQNLSPTVVVSNGDSLTVTWVITIGTG